jgi:uncharacterized protein
MNEEKNLEVVKQGYEHFGSGDIEGLLSLFDEKISWTTPNVEGAPHTGARTGRNEVATFFEQLAETEEFTRFEPNEFIAQNDKVVVLGESESTVKDTGRSFTTPWVHIFTLRDGKITGFLEFFDNALASKAFQKELTAGTNP